MNFEELEKEIRSAIKGEGGIKHLAKTLYGMAQEIEDDDNDNDNEDEQGMDVRLRYHYGNIFLYSGSSDYDQDHRGHWGSSSVQSDTTKDDCFSIAEDLLDQVLDNAAQSLPD